MTEHSYPGAERPAQRHHTGQEHAEPRHLLVSIQALLMALAILMLLFSVSAHSESYPFRAFQRAEGLENLNIHSVVQDHSGKLWLGTENGLFRFDGERMARVPTFEDHDLPFIQALAEDGAGRLWVADSHELIYLDAAGPHRPALPRFGVDEVAANAIASLPGERDTIYLLADRRLFRIQSADGGATWRETPVFAGGTLAIRSLLATPPAAPPAAAGPGGRLWMGCGDQICSASPDGASPGERAVRRWGVGQGVPHDDWLQLFRDHRGRIWARGVQHLISLPAGAQRFTPEEHGLPGRAFDMRGVSLAEDPQGRLLTNLTDGIGRLEGDRWHIFTAANGLPHELTGTLAFDHDGAFWFSVAGHGLMHWIGYDNWELWTERDGMGVGDVWGLGEDRQSRLWAASELDLVQLPAGPDRRAVPQASGHPMRQTQAVVVDPSGHVWVGDGAGNVKVYDPATRQVRIAASQLSTVYNLQLDPDGAIWICSRKGLYRMEPGDGYRALLSSAGGAPMPAGGFYRAQRAGGTHYFEGERGLFTFKADPKSGAGAFTPVALPARVSYVLDGPMAVASDGTVWLQGEATPLLHLRIHDGRAELLEQIGVPRIASPSIYQISIDRRGWLWVGTDQGLDVYNGRDWVGVTAEDGLVWDDTDTDSFHSSADGSVWIGTSGGLAHMLHPETLFERQPLRIDPNNVRLGGAAVALDGSSRVPWKDRGAFTLRLAVSDPARAPSVRYRFRMEGLENDWQDTDDPSIRYSALPPGRYRLAVMAVDPRRHQESAPLYIEFRLLPPWWRTSWFLCLLAVTLAGLVGLGSWWRVGALMAQQQHLEELVRERTKQLEMEKRDLLEARLALVEQSTRDGLTGLLNRSAIFEVLTNEITYANDKHTPLAIVLADLDHFKRINDTYGHQVGDAVLRECARRFRLATRPTDYVGRYGGEELLLIMPGLSPENSMERLQYLRASIAHEMFDCEGIGLPVTCSFGVAWLDDRVRAVKPLMALADQALHAAKSRGRNRVETMFTSASGLFFPDGSGPLAASR